jgi:hypothetical protein
MRFDRRERNHDLLVEFLGRHDRLLEDHLSKLDCILGSEAPGRQPVNHVQQGHTGQRSHVVYVMVTDDEIAVTKRLLENPVFVLHDSPFLHRVRIAAAGS